MPHTNVEMAKPRTTAMSYSSRDPWLPADAIAPTPNLPMRSEKAGASQCTSDATPHDPRRAPGKAVARPKATFLGGAEAEWHGWRTDRTGLNARRAPIPGTRGPWGAVFPRSSGLSSKAAIQPSANQSSRLSGGRGASLPTKKRERTPGMRRLRSKASRRAVPRPCIGKLGAARGGGQGSGAGKRARSVRPRRDPSQGRGGSPGQDPRAAASRALSSGVLPSDDRLKWCARGLSGEQAWVRRQRLVLEIDPFDSSTGKHGAKGNLRSLLRDDAADPPRLGVYVHSPHQLHHKEQPQPQGSRSTWRTRATLACRCVQSLGQSEEPVRDSCPFLRACSLSLRHLSGGRHLCERGVGLRGISGIAQCRPLHIQSRDVAVLSLPHRYPGSMVHARASSAHIFRGIGTSMADRARRRGLKRSRKGGSRVAFLRSAALSPHTRHHALVVSLPAGACRCPGLAWCSEPRWRLG